MFVHLNKYQFSKSIHNMNMSDDLKINNNINN